MTVSFDKLLEGMLDGEDIDSLPSITEQPPMEPVIYDVVESCMDEEAIPNKDTLEDYKLVRSNIHTLLGKTNAALELTLKFAQMSENPKLLDNISTLLLASNNLSKTLLGLQKSIAVDTKSKKGDKSNVVNNIQQNNYYSKEETKSIGNIIDQLDDE